LGNVALDRGTTGAQQTSQVLLGQQQFPFWLLA
jgi:hypothetical protein